MYFCKYINNCHITFMYSERTLQLKVTYKCLSWFRAAHHRHIYTLGRQLGAGSSNTHCLKNINSNIIDYKLIA